MSEEYEKRDQNYNFWNEQAKSSQNNNEPHIEQKTIISQEDTALEEPASARQMEQQYQGAAEGLTDNTFIVHQENQPIGSTAIVHQENQPIDSTAIVHQENQPIDSTAIMQQENQSIYGSNLNIYPDTIYTANSYENPQEFSENTEEKKDKSKTKGIQKKIVGLIASAAIFGVVAGGVFSGVQYVGNKIFPQKTGAGKITSVQNGGNKISTTTVSKNAVVTGPTDVTNVVEKAMPSIVSITSKITKNYGYFGTQDSEGSGSGIIINKGNKELLIVTNNHVIADSNTISVKFIDDSVVSAVIKGTSSTADLAVLSVKLSDIKESTLDKISVIEMGDSSETKVGQMAIAIGNALGYGQAVTVGYISAKDREVEVENYNTMKLLQTDAAINPGNSGGALLDKDGKLIGINSAKYSDTSVEGMGYAIPISVAAPIINDLMNREILTENEKGYLGVSVTEVTAEIAKAYNRPEGVAVSAVSEDGAAKEAGILVGDIITKVEDTEIKTGTALQEKVNSLRAGTKVKVTLMRYVNGTYEEKEIEVTLKDKDTLNSLEEESSQPQNDNNKEQQKPNQENGDDNSNNGRGGQQQIDPDDEERLREFLEYYFGE